MLPLCSNTCKVIYWLLKYISVTHTVICLLCPRYFAGHMWCADDMLSVFNPFIRGPLGEVGAVPWSWFSALKAVLEGTGGVRSSELMYLFRDGENEIRFQGELTFYLPFLFLAFLESSPTSPKLLVGFLGPFLLHHNHFIHPSHSGISLSCSHLAHFPAELRFNTSKSPYCYSLCWSFLRTWLHFVFHSSTLLTLCKT